MKGCRERNNLSLFGTAWDCFGLFAENNGRIHNDVGSYTLGVNGPTGVGWLRWIRLPQLAADFSSRLVVSRPPPALTETGDLNEVRGGVAHTAQAADGTGKTSVLEQSATSKSLSRPGANLGRIGEDGLNEGAEGSGWFASSVARCVGAIQCQGILICRPQARGLPRADACSIAWAACCIGGKDARHTVNTVRPCMIYHMISYDISYDIFLA